MASNVGRMAGVALLAVLAASLAGCAMHRRQVKSNALEFLYPKGATAAPPVDVALRLPVRVGVAFAPPVAGWADAFSEVQKQELLGRLVAAFQARQGIESVQMIPSSYLAPGGGFENVDRVKAAFGIDVLALLSYDQFQFSESGHSSWAYWTIVGAYLVRGEKHETRTVVDAAVFDIASRGLLFNASGRSQLQGKATPIGVGKALRTRSEEGIAQAVDDLIANLGPALDAFQAQAATGTVRGAGTPAIALVDAQGNPVTPAPAGLGGGSCGLLELAVCALLFGAVRAERRRG